MCFYKPDKSDDRCAFRYENCHNAPYFVFIERTDTEQENDRNLSGIGRLIMRLFGDLFENQSFVLRKSGKNRFRISLNNFDTANKLIEGFNKLESFRENEKWIAYIPNFKLFKDFVVYGIFDKEATPDEVMEWLHSAPGTDEPFPEILKAERIKRVDREKTEDGRGKIIYEDKGNGRSAPRLVDSHLFKIRCKTTKVPSRAVFCGVIVDVTPFVDRPRRCNHCQRFGHIARFCKSSKKPVICGKCAQSGHDSPSCVSDKPECINCKRNGLEDTAHAVFDRRCPILITNQKIKEVIAYHNVDNKKAKEILETNGGRNPPVEKKTFAEVVIKSDLALLVKNAKLLDDAKRKAEYVSRRKKALEREAKKKQENEEKKRKKQKELEEIEMKQQQETIENIQLGSFDPQRSKELKEMLAAAKEKYAERQVRNQQPLEQMVVDQESMKRKKQQEKDEKDNTASQGKKTKSANENDENIKETLLSHESCGGFSTEKSDLA